MLSVVLTVSDGVDLIWRDLIRSINRNFSWWFYGSDIYQVSMQSVVNDLGEALKSTARDFRGPK